MEFEKKRLITRVAASLLSAVAVLLFFGLRYPYHLHYQEQFQLFQFTWAYFRDLVVIPGGLACWGGRFLTQFCYFYWAGAFILAALFSAIQALTYRNFRQAPYSVSFIPAVLVFLFLLDENALFSAPVALALSLLALTASKKAGTAVCLVLQAVLLFLLGPLSITYGLSIAVQRKSVPTAIITALIFIVLSFAAYQVFPYSFNNLLYGLNYHRYRSIIPVLPIAAALAIPATGLVPSLKPVFNILIFAAIAAAAIICTSKIADFSKEEMMKYDFHARMKLWNRTLAMADRKSPRTPISVSCLNLALAMTDRIGDGLFQYYQNGPQGLLGDFVRDYTSPLSTAEAYYRMGMINTAQRFVFEAQEAIPDYQKSARCYARLAETNLLNGDYDVARKYLIPLTHTLFYRRWALSVLPLLGDEEAIARHPEYGPLRRFRFSGHDFLFSNDEMVSMLGLLSMENHDNRVAYNYLLAWTLLSKDLNRFAECLSLVQFDAMPRAYQEALLLLWVQTHSDTDGLPPVIDRRLVAEMEAFMRDSSARKDAGYMEKVYGRTYWFYYLYRYR